LPALLLRLPLLPFIYISEHYTSLSHAAMKEVKFTILSTLFHRGVTGVLKALLIQEGSLLLSDAAGTEYARIENVCEFSFVFQATKWLNMNNPRWQPGARITL
jgi:hypothetical protein